MKYLNILLLFTSLSYTQERININILSNANNTNTYHNDYNDFNAFFQESKNIKTIDSVPTHSLESYKEEYLKKFYAPWDSSKINTDKNSIFYAAPALENAISYQQELEWLKLQNDKQNAQKIAKLEQKINTLLGVGENLLPNTIQDFTDILNNLNLDSFLHDPKIAIVIQATSIRALPTQKPRYKNAEDYPFDRWQHSLIFEGTPILITHFSKDKKYAHIQGPFVYGWVDVRNIALVNNNLRNKLLHFKNYKIPTKDLIPLYFNNQWILEARIGQIFPYNKRKNKILTFYKDIEGYAQIREVPFPTESFTDFPMPIHEKNVLNILQPMIGQKYGWGGLFSNRDCSAFTRDIFATFGIFLPRNSAAQAQFKGKFIDLAKMSNYEKEKYILENAIPFGTLIWLKGHIMLYVGAKEINGIKRAIVAHSAWAVKPTINDKQEQIPLGSVQITTMDIGGAFDSNAVIKNSLLSRIQGITNIATHPLQPLDLSHFTITH